MDRVWTGVRIVQTEPEILPPEGRDAPRGYGRAAPGAFEAPPAGPASRRRASRWASAPATYILVGINCLVYLAMVLNGVSPSNPTVTDLVHWGANFGGYVLAGQWWRLVTAAFVHVGMLHLATNMWCLWNLGLLGEPLLGPLGLLAVYLMTGVAGNLLSTSIHPQIVGAGASGAVFGLAGVLIMLLKSPLLPVPREEVKRLRQSVIYFAVLNFVIGGGTLLFRTRLQIDNMAHLGGFLCGLVLGMLLLPKIGAPKSQFVFRGWAAYGGMTLLLLVFAFGVASFYR
jgi:membrane associated rhomboid family serine protease